MPQSTYDLIASALRYWFVFLIALIFLRVALGAWREYRLESPAADSGWGLYVWLPVPGLDEFGEINEEAMWMPVARRIQIGRGAQNELILPDPTVSLYHAQVYTSGKRLLIEDLDSHNGTYVNEINIKRVTRLREGDVIAMGNQMLRVGREGSEGA